MNKSSKLFIFIAIIISIIALTHVFGAEITQQMEQEALDAAQNWVNSIRARLESDNKEDRYNYYVSGGYIDDLDSYKLLIDGNKIYYKVDDTTRVPIDLNAKLKLSYDSFIDKDNNTIPAGEINFTLNQVIASGNDGGMVYFTGSQSITAQKVGEQEVTINGQRKKMEMISVNGITIPREHLFQDRNISIDIDYSVAGQAGTRTLGPGDTQYVRKGESWGARALRWIVDKINKLANIGLDILSRIVNLVVYFIGHGLHALINRAVGQELTIGKIVYGKTDLFTINFWDIDMSQPPTSGFNIAYKLHDIVSYWYGFFRGLGIGVYLVILLYVGIKILLSSTSKGIQDAKQKLASWIMGIIILFFAPILMKYTVKLNDSLVQLVAEGSGSQNEDIMTQVGESGKNEGILVLSIIYVIMVGQLLVLIMTYYKRAFMLSYLIVIFPIVATYYIWEKTQKGGARSMENWTKEFTTLVFTQLVHAVVYAVLIEGMYQALVKDNGNYILYILCVTFLFKAEGIVKQIFNVRSVANTVGDLAASGATAVALTQSIGGMFKGEKKDSPDEADEKETSRQKETLENAARERNARRQVLEEEQGNRPAGRSGSLENGAGASGANTSEGSAQGRTNQGASARPSGLGFAGSSGNGDMSEGTGERTRIDAQSINNAGENSSIRITTPGGPQVQNNGQARRITRSSTTRENQQRMRESKEMNDLQKARTVLKNKALKVKKGGIFMKGARFTIRNAGRAAGIALGLAVGAATGDPKNAIKNAAIAGKVGSKLGNLAAKPLDYGVGRIQGANMRRKVERGDYNDDLRKAGVSEEFIEHAYENAKGDAIRKALAKEMSGTRRGGKALGEVKFTGTMEKEHRDQQTR